MRIDITTICHSSLQINEDILGYNPKAIWILDGATSISGRKLEIERKMESDASWFVNQFSNLFAKLDHDIQLEQQLKSIIESIQHHAVSVWGNWAEQDVPSASFSAAFYNNKNISLYNLGDCRILYQLDHQPVKEFGQSNVETFDRDLLEQYKTIAQQSPRPTHKQIWQQLVDQIRANRLRMNQKDGYWILSPDGRGIDQLQKIDLQFHEDAKVLLSTDGLYRLVDTYKQMDTADFFKKAFEKNGLNELLSQLRKIEDSDPEAIEHPRVKLQDDASAVLIHLNP